MQEETQRNTENAERGVKQGGDPAMENQLRKCFPRQEIMSFATTMHCKNANIRSSA